MKSTLLGVTLGTTLLAAAIAAAGAAQPSAKFNPLRVSLTAATADSGGFLGAVEVVVTNTGNRTVRVPKWELPSELLEAKLFQVSRDGVPVQYEGPMIKRGLPGAEDFAILRAGESYRAVVDLTAAYDMTQSGRYVVTLVSPLQHASVSGGEMLKDTRGLPMLLQTAPLNLWVDGKDQLGAVQQAKPPKPDGSGVVVNGVTYKGCTTSRIDTAGQAVAAARNYSENGKGYLNSGATGPRYTTWFGAYTAARYSTAQQHFAAIDTALDQSGGQIAINCGCNQNYYAYVYPNRPYEIFVCRAFWSAPLVGTDSKAGTLIHETSHFNVVAGTDDIVYGQAGAKNLALSDPNGALNNADNHEYFAENTPSQN